MSQVAYHLKPARPVEDEDFLLSLYASTRTEELDSVPWPPGQRQAFERQQFQLQRQHYATHYPRAEHSLVLVGEQPVGRIYVDRDEQRIYLVDLALVPEFRSRGLGVRLLGQLIQESEQSGRRIELAVFVGNPRALAFYQRLGFQVVGSLNELYLSLHRLPQQQPG